MSQNAHAKAQRRKAGNRKLRSSGSMTKGDVQMPASSCLRIVFFLCLLTLPISAQETLPRVAVVTTVWRHNSHADVIGSRLVQGNTLDGKGEFPKLKLVSAYVDQFPANDMSQGLAKEHGFMIYDTVAGALTLGGERLAVDGVLLICEHGDYPRNETGSIQYP